MKFTSLKYGMTWPLFSPLFRILYDRYCSLMAESREVAAKVIVFGDMYLKVVIPIIRNPNLDLEIKSQTIRTSIKQLDSLKQDTKHLVDGLESLRKDLINFIKELDAFARHVGDKLSKEVNRIRCEIEELEKKLKEQQREYKKHSPTTPSDPSDLFPLFTTASGILASSSTIATLVTMMSAKVVEGSVVVAAGSAGAVSTLTVVAPAMVIALIIHGVHKAWESAESMSPLKESPMKELVKDVTRRMERIVNVWDTLCVDAEALEKTLLEGPLSASSSWIENHLNPISRLLKNLGIWCYRFRAQSRAWVFWSKDEEVEILRLGGRMFATVNVYQRIFMTKEDRVGGYWCRRSIRARSRTGSLLELMTIRLHDNLLAESYLEHPVISIALESFYKFLPGQLPGDIGTQYFIYHEELDF
ncbi:hypothetical protein M422DRAFT_46271 [Sphaerobolus stellatus SS14]|uniref:Uncharacterized protein n=1 Tax=Sphaerobolus stellatus (strain SS14) TaxID=990650 RepID=A0A0C9VGV3_SPHS4|nr:hypothetical protein M422DRAFT_46271 [Sphaerobolus stellatus SS14]